MIKFENLEYDIKKWIKSLEWETYSPDYVYDHYGKHHKKYFSRGKMTKPYVGPSDVDISVTFTEDSIDIKITQKPENKSQFLKKLKKAYLAQELSK